MSLLQGLGFQIKEAYPIVFRKCRFFIVWYHIVDSIMSNILKDPKRLVTSSPQYGYRYLSEKKRSHIFSTYTVWVFDKRKGWCHLSILFYNVRKRNLLFHYYGCSVSH